MAEFTLVQRDLRNASKSSTTHVVASENLPKKLSFWLTSTAWSDISGNDNSSLCSSQPRSLAHPLQLPEQTKGFNKSRVTAVSNSHFNLFARLKLARVVCTPKSAQSTTSKFFSESAKISLFPETSLQGWPASGDRVSWSWFKSISIISFATMPLSCASGSNKGPFSAVSCSCSSSSETLARESGSTTTDDRKSHTLSSNLRWAKDTICQKWSKERQFAYSLSLLREERFRRQTFLHSHYQKTLSLGCKNYA